MKVLEHIRACVKVTDCCDSINIRSGARGMMGTCLHATM
jgi:hypothetical protein